MIQLEKKREGHEQSIGDGAKRPLTVIDLRSGRSADTVDWNVQNEFQDGNGAPYVSSPEALEKMPARPNPADEAYRHYAMGVAYEALGHGAEDADTTRKYLDQASTQSSNAIDGNPQAYESMDNPLQQRSAKAPLERVQRHLFSARNRKEFVDASVLKPLPFRVETR